MEATTIGSECGVCIYRVSDGRRRWRAVRGFRALRWVVKDMDDVFLYDMSDSDDCVSEILHIRVASLALTIMYTFTSLDIPFIIFSTQIYQSVLAYTPTNSFIPLSPSSPVTLVQITPFTLNNHTSARQYSLTIVTGRNEMKGRLVLLPKYLAEDYPPR